MCRSVPANKGPMARGVQEGPVASVRPSAVKEGSVCLAQLAHWGPRQSPSHSSSELALSSSAPVPTLPTGQRAPA